LVQPKPSWVGYPLQWVAVEGLGRYGEQALAKDIAHRWIATVARTPALADQRRARRRRDRTGLFGAGMSGEERK
jgi:neutral trehalase